MCVISFYFQRNSSSLSPEHNKYEWSGNRSPDVASESGKRRKMDDKVCSCSCDKTCALNSELIYRYSLHYYTVNNVTVSR